MRLGGLAWLKRLLGKLDDAGRKEQKIAGSKPARGFKYGECWKAREGSFAPQTNFLIATQNQAFCFLKEANIKNVGGGGIKNYRGPMKGQFLRENLAFI